MNFFKHQWFKEKHKGTGQTWIIQRRNTHTYLWFCLLDRFPKMHVYGCRRNSNNSAIRKPKEQFSIPPLTKYLQKTIPVKHLVVAHSLNTTCQFNCSGRKVDFSQPTAKWQLSSLSKVDSHFSKRTTKRQLSSHTKVDLKSSKTHR